MLDPRFRLFAEELAELAGTVIRRYYRQPVEIDEKSDATPVTQADREAESAMRALIEKRFPEHGILGEEHGEVNAGAEWRWVLDPVDGTKSFVLGIPMFVTLIALEHRGQPVLGVIDQPILRERVIGDGVETRLNGAPIRARACPALRDAYLLATDPLLVEKHFGTKGFDRLTHAVKCFRAIGDGYSYGLLAAGYADVVLDPIMNPWDVAALIPVVRGAGGVITDWHSGDPVGKSSTVAAAPEIHAQVIATLNGA